MVAAKLLGDWEWSGHQCRSW